MVKPADSKQQAALDRGLVQIYTGDGKGKTSAALGQALRAAGHGLRTFFVFFMKVGYLYGEQDSLAGLRLVTVARFGNTDYVDPENVKPEDTEQAQLALTAAREAMNGGNYDLVVLDEVNVAVAWKLLPLNDVVELIENKPQNVELILTGRHADPALLVLADLVTEMTKVKHPYDRGIAARKGIEY